MDLIDVNLFVGDCPFRAIPSSVSDLKRLREDAGLERAVATSFSSLFYYDPQEGLARDLERYAPLSDWLSFYAVVNPDFPQLEGQIEHAASDERIVGIRLFPTLHHYALDSDRVTETLGLAAKKNLPVNLTARLTDERMAPRYLDQATLSSEALAAFLLGAEEVTVILSMFFFRELQALPVEWSRMPRVYLDLGCAKPSVASFDRIPSWFPAERVLFGSGAPLYYWKGSRLAVEGAGLSEDQKSAMLGRTAREVLAWS
ncbi:MAG: amidohydrolase family protein [Candidatus Latescibacterota bacterium]